MRKKERLCRFLNTTHILTLLSVIRSYLIKDLRIHRSCCCIGSALDEYKVLADA
jgi:hypothetical protein